MVVSNSQFAHLLAPEAADCGGSVSHVPIQFLNPGDSQLHHLYVCIHGHQKMAPVMQIFHFLKCK